MEIPIPIMGIAALYLLGRNNKYRKYGFIIGFAAQPFWFFTQLTAKNYIIAGFVVILFFVWGMGIYNNFLKPQNDIN
jgi:hypothetical protein